jgi:hypothetical protein
VMPCEVGKAVDGLLSGAAQPGEDLAGQLHAMRPDLGRLGDQARGLARRIEDPVFLAMMNSPLSADFSWRRRGCQPLASMAARSDR